jgi:hypothetical protein
MQLRQVIVRTGDANQPAITLECGAQGAVVSLPARWAAALPALLRSVLTPRDVTALDLVRLCGSSAQAAWRLVIAVGAQQVRLSRGYAESSLLLEVWEPDQRTWRREGQGLAEVERQLGRLVPMKEGAWMAALHSVVNPAAARVPDAERGQSSMGMEVQSRGDYESVLTGTALNLEPLEDDEATRLAGLWSHARTTELLESQIRSHQQRLDEHIASMNRIIDAGGELAEVSAALARETALRPITEGEREALSWSEERLADLQRRIMEAESGHGPRSRRGIEAWMPLGVTAAGVVLSLAMFVAVVALGSRQLLSVSVFPFSVTLLGVLMVIQTREEGEVAVVRDAAQERRLERLREEFSYVHQTREALRRELDVSSLQQYEAASARIDRLRRREQALLQSHVRETQSEAYQQAMRQKEALEQEREQRRRLLAQIPSVPQSAEDLRMLLEQGGLDPEVLLWMPRSPREQMDQDMQTLHGLLRASGRWSEGQGLAPALVEAWGKVHSRLTQQPPAVWNLDERGCPQRADTPDAWASMRAEARWALLESLRVALVLAMQGGPDGDRVPGWWLRVHEDRVHDPALANPLQTLYANLGRRLQVVLVRAA